MVRLVDRCPNRWTAPTSPLSSTDPQAPAISLGLRRRQFGPRAVRRLAAAGCLTGVLGSRFEGLLDSRKAFIHEGSDKLPEFIG